MTDKQSPADAMADAVGRHVEWVLASSWTPLQHDTVANLSKALAAYRAAPPMPDKLTPADAMADAVGKMLYYFEGWPLSKPTPAAALKAARSISILSESLAAYRTAPQMPSPERILGAMETYQQLYTGPCPSWQEEAKADKVLDELRKVVNNGNL